MGPLEICHWSGVLRNSSSWLREACAGDNSSHVVLVLTERRVQRSLSSVRCEHAVREALPKCQTRPLFRSYGVQESDSRECHCLDSIRLGFTCLLRNRPRQTNFSTPYLVARRATNSISRPAFRDDTGNLMLARLATVCILHLEDGVRTDTKHRLASPRCLDPHGCYFWPTPKSHS